MLLILFYVNEKFKLDYYRLIVSSIIILMILSFTCEPVDWYRHIHPFPAGYLYMGEGAKFPLLPNLVYILAGALLGKYIAHNHNRINPSKFRLILISSGVILILIYELLNFLYHLSGNPFNILSKTTNMVYIRAGLVILIIYIILELSTKLNRLPKIIEVTGRYSLLIYVVHLFILYGSALNRGMAYYYSYSFNILESVISAVGLIILMILLAYAAHFVESGKWLLCKR